MNAPASESLLSPEVLARQAEVAGRLRTGLNRILLGQEALVDEVLTCFLARGHLLLEGLPGLGKTELVKGLAGLLSLEFRRIQFTPDLLPGDITGTHILEETPQGGRSFVFHKGPVFANVLLADEINRASPKTQAALLEAMQEGQVTLLGVTHALPDPFFALATQNPIEMEGTYPLPEAQLDRFLFKVEVKGVSQAVLTDILTTRRRGRPPAPEAVLGGGDLATLLEAVEKVHLPKAVAEYVARLTAATHPQDPGAPAEVRRLVRYGASPRAAIAMAAAGRAAALLAGKPNVGFEEIRRVAPPVLRHRVLLNYQAGLEGATPNSVVGAVLQSVGELARRPVEVGA